MVVQQCALEEHQCEEALNALDDADVLAGMSA